MRICWICENRSNLLKIGWIFDPQFKTNLFKSRFMIHDTNWIWICDPQLDSNPRVHNSLILFLQPYFLDSQSHDWSFDLLNKFNWNLLLQLLISWKIQNFADLVIEITFDLLFWSHGIRPLDPELIVNVCRYLKF